MGDLEKRIAALSPEKRELLLRKLAAEKKEQGGIAVLERKVGKVFPLSFAQQRLWFIEQLTPGLATYHIHLALEICGELDVVALEKSLQGVVKRHESLRTVFVERSGEPGQVVEEFVGGGIGFCDACQMGYEGVLRELPGCVKEPFDLKAGPLFRAYLWKVGEKKHVFLFVVHHIVADAWSMGVWAQELLRFYRHFAYGEELGLEALSHQYVEYSQWQREWPLEKLDKELEYWQGQLARMPHALEFASDFPRPLRPSFRGARLGFAPGVSFAWVEELARRENVTPFVVLLGAYQILLARFARQEDFGVGTPIANRTRQEWEKLIGFFVNTLVVRSEVRGERTVGEFLQSLKNSTVAAYQHQDLPFAKLVEKLQPERDMSRSPLFQVGFTWQNAPLPRLETAGLSWEVLPFDPGMAKFDLGLYASADGGQWQCYFEYSTDLFERETVAQLARCWEVVLKQMGERNKKLAEIALEEERPVAASFPVVEKPFVSVLESWQQQVVACQDKVAVKGDGLELSYGELNRRVNQLACYIQEKHGQPQWMGIAMERSCDLVVAILACLKCAAAYVPVDPSSPVARQRFILQDAKVDLVLVDCAKDSREVAGEIPVVDYRAALGAVKEFPAEVEVPSVYADDPAYMIYTSGSTGKPKGVVVSHHNVARLFSSTEELFGFSADDVWTLFHSYAFDFSVWEMFGALLYGGTLVIVPSLTARSPEQFYQLLAKEGVTVLNQTPSAFQQLVAYDADKKPTDKLALRLVIFGGEKLQLASLLPWTKRHGLSPALVNMYGITEITVHATFHFIRQEDLAFAHRSVIGESLPDLRIYLLDNNRQPVPRGFPGEIYVSGPGVAKGYWQRPRLTAQRFVADPFVSGWTMYRSGDLARELSGGKLEYLERADQQVKIRGYRVELGEIESQLHEHPVVKECVVALRQQGESAYLVAYVVAEGDVLPVSSLREFLEERLPAYMVPGNFMALDALPLTANGKIDYQALPEPHWEESQELLAPCGEIEETIARCYQEILELKQVGRETHFFHQGGHSLLATKLCALISESLEQEVALRLIFEKPRVRELAQAVAELGQGAQIQKIPHAGQQESYPLSFAQQRLWFIDQLQPGSPAYNIPLTFVLEGQLDVKALEKSLRTLMREQTVLRTTFRSERGEPRQVIEEVPDVVLQVEEVSPEQEILPRLRQEVERPFDLATELPWRAQLLRQRPKRHFLVIITHHIVFDGSMELFLRELKRLYQTFRQGQEPESRGEMLRYVDYAIWQRRYLSGEVLQEQLQYWKRKLGGKLPTLHLPTDFPRPMVYSFQGDRYFVELSQKLAQRLQRLAQDNDTTLFMTILAAFKIFLYRYTEQEDLIVGTPINNRNRQELQDLLGCFVNTLALRTEVTGEMSYQELLQQVRQTTLEAYQHQEIPFEMLVEELQPERDLSHTPIFQVMLVVQHMYWQQMQLPEVEMEFVAEAHLKQSRFDLLVNFLEHQDGLRLSLEYNTDLFQRETIARWSRHLQRILEQVVQEPEQKVAEVALLSTQEKEQIVYQWNSTAMPFPEDNVVQWIYRKVQSQPDAVALVTHQRQLSYRELWEEAERVACHLQVIGVRAGDCVGVFVERSAEMVVAILGILQSQAAYVPLEPMYPDQRLRWIIEHVPLKTVISESTLTGRLARDEDKESAAGRQLVLLGDKEASAVAGWQVSYPQEPVRFSVDIAGITPDDLAYIIFTSGSTGVPKGVMVTHRPVVNLIHWAERAFPAAAWRKALGVASVGFDLSVFDILGILAMGGSLRLASREEVNAPERLVEILLQEQITFWNSAPQALNQLLPLLQQRDTSGSALQLVFLSGDWIPLALPKKLHSSFEQCQVIALGGATEATVWSNFFKVEELAASWSSVPYGYPIANSQYHVLDGYLQPCPIGVAGDLFIAGECLSLGYVNAPRTTAQSFLPYPFGEGRMYRTGDRARYWADGTIEFLGRLDHQVKIRGFRVELGEIEHALQDHPVVKESVVTTKSKGGEKLLVAYYVAETPVTKEELQRFMRKRLPEYMVPSFFVPLSTIPLTANGKLHHEALPDPVAEEKREIVAPEGEIEEVLLEMWQGLLEQKSISIHDNFFDLGGHSLLATQLVSQIQEMFELEVPLRTIFENATIAQLALELERMLVEEIDQMEDDEC